MVIKQTRIRESKKRDTALQHTLLLVKLEPCPDGEDTSNISVTERDWKVEVEAQLEGMTALVKAMASAINTLQRAQAVKPKPKAATKKK